MWPIKHGNLMQHEQLYWLLENNQLLENTHAHTYTTHKHTNTHARTLHTTNKQTRTHTASFPFTACPYAGPLPAMGR